MLGTTPEQVEAADADEASPVPSPGPGSEVRRALVESWLRDHGDALWRYAMARTRHPETAEDLVQSTLLAAVSAASVVPTPAARVWLLGVMSHKIADHYRAQHRRPSAGAPHRTDDPDHEPADAPGQGRFTAHGMWVRAPAELPAPDARATHAEQSAALRACMEKLPPTLDQVFWLREVMGVSADQVCASLRISAANLWQRMHRARTALRECLEAGGEGGAAERGSGEHRGGEERRR